MPDSRHVRFVVTLYTSNFQPDTKHVLIDFLYPVTLLPEDTDVSRSNDWKHYVCPNLICFSLHRVLLCCLQTLIKGDINTSDYLRPVARRISEVSV